MPGADHFASANISQISLDDDMISITVDQVFNVLSKRYGLTKTQLWFCLNAAGITLGSFCPIKPTPDCSQVQYVRPFQLTIRYSNFQFKNLHI